MISAAQRILVIGEEADWGTISKNLEQAGLQLRRVSAVGVSGTVFEEQPFDAAIIDLDVLQAQGLELFEAALRVDAAAVCVAAGGPDSQVWVLQALEAGAYAQVRKPCRLPVLRHTLERGFERRRLVKELRLRERTLQTLNSELDSKIEEATRELRALNERTLNEIANLREVDKLKTDFLGNVTHDLKNPLTTLRGYISYLGDDPDIPPDERKFCIENCRATLMHMEYLIDQLLEAARLTSGKIKLSLREFPLAGLLEEAGALVRGQADAGGIRFEIVADRDKSLTLSADRGRLRQVLSNLLGNACKFTPKGGRIGLRAWAEKENVHFCVEDTGIGIALEHQARIFEKFYQVDSSLSKAFKGLGLGLRITKDIVELHGGRIWVESQTQMGCRFHFVVPRRGFAETAR